MFVIDDETTMRWYAAEAASLLRIPCEMFASAEHFLERLDPSRPGCVISELHLSGMNGLQLQERLAELDSTLYVVLVSGDLNIPITVRAMQNGAVAVFEKPCDTDLLTAAVRVALDLSRNRHRARETQDVVFDRFERLDSRERAVMGMVVQGLPNKAIARELDVCQRTAARIRSEVYEKMAVDSAVELAQAAFLMRRPKSDSSLKAAGGARWLHKQHGPSAAVPQGRTLWQRVTR
jgi:FixJ family two-component response regulator